LLVGKDKALNLNNAIKAIEECVTKGANIVCLPEMFNCPYSNDSFGPYSEAIPNGSVCQQLLQTAKNNNVYIVGGSIPEKLDSKLYNTSMVFDTSGKMIAKHQKLHLFDIDIPGQITFKESETLTAGDSLTMFDTKYGKIGVGICYDIRFAEMAMSMRAAGCKLLIYPGAFNMTTGPAHWELLARSRALDNQCFVAITSPSRNPDSTYQAWGHSTVVNPWGEVIATTDHNPGIVMTDVDLSKVEEIRGNIPISKQRRYDVYTQAKSMKE